MCNPSKHMCYNPTTCVVIKAHVLMQDGISVEAAHTAGERDEAKPGGGEPIDSGEHLTSQSLQVLHGRRPEYSGLSPVCLSVCLFTHYSGCLCVYLCLSVCVYMCLSVHSSIYPLLCLPVCVCVCVCACVSICLSIHLSITSSVCLSIHLSICLN